MAEEFKIDQIELNRLMKKLDKISFVKKVQTYIKGMTSVTLAVEARLKMNVAGRILKIRSGRLASSMGSRVMRTADGVSGLVGSGVRSGKRVSYADIHETGGTITPKHGKYLTIPLDGAKTASGVARFSAGDVFNGSAGYDGGFIRKSKKGNLILFGKTGKSIIPLFVLKRSVTIPARRYLSVTLIQMQSKIIQIMTNTVNNALKGE